MTSDYVEVMRLKEMLGDIEDIVISMEAGEFSDNEAAIALIREILYAE